ncbi:MAG: methylmalonyl Co-A mutase-associated GTPase MeaB [Promethearchaeota archaeon]
MDNFDLIAQLKKKNTRAAARLITIVENNIRDSEEIIKSLYKDTGKAYILGITGAPGSGKSTFISTITKKFVDQGKKVGIICVDPTSPLTGGALLGDRIRMKDNFSLENVFIRSMANRGQLGGLARATEDAIKILDVYGCDIIIVETVGVGQSEIDIFRSAHTVIVLLVPGTGDDIQAIKAGLMEITDIFAVNKMDLPGADKKVADIIQMLELNKNYTYVSEKINAQNAKIKEWTPEIIKLNSKTGKNFDKLCEIITRHEQFLKKEKIFNNYMINRIKAETMQILKYKLVQKIEDLLNSNHFIKENELQVLNKSLDPYSMANMIIKSVGLDQ